jgi:SAM-dependent methyltransferase
MSRIPNDLWSESARQYDSFEKKWNFYGTVAAALIRGMRIPEDARVLELACGTGACTMQVARAVSKGSIVALDLSEGMLSVAEENVRAAGFTNVSFVHGSAADVAELLSGRKFDFALCNSAFWQFPEQDKVLRDLRALLMGPAVFGVSLPSWAEGDPRDRDAFRAKLREVLTSHGVSVEEVERLFARTPQRPNLREVFEKSGFRTRVEKFEFSVPQESRQEWSRIPVFSQRRGWDWGASNLDATAKEQVREEMSEWRKTNFPRGTANSRWMLYVATPSGVPER